ncbi:MAG: signal peptide-containing protein [Uliginosibacterium sp.]|nr:signal peptide-containing protein [Uliginosibacterium sp.]
MTKRSPQNADFGRFFYSLVRPQNPMHKFLAFCIFLVLAVLAAGAFGALHDQISYSVSPEYFTRFKFFQFQLLDPAVPERLRAAQVGFLASWWMGIPLGLLSGVAAFIHRSPAKMQRALAWSLLVIVGFTLAFAIAGLTYGFIQTETIEPSRYTNWFIPSGVNDLRHFLCVGYMHNAAYLGGALAIPIAWGFHLAFWYRNRHVA